MADLSAMRRWILIHLTRLWTALFTLAGLGAAFVYKPEWLTLYLRTTMTAIETGAAALPYPWGDRLRGSLAWYRRFSLDAVCFCNRGRSGNSVVSCAVH